MNYIKLHQLTHISYCKYLLFLLFKILNNLTTLYGDYYMATHYVTID